MHTDTDRCYRAVSSRDARFDGRFVTAVTTTGIYCRPSCPAQTPKRTNVRFYACAAAAVAAGFRACRRCRPEAAPGSREWDARADLAARALRAIAAGALDGRDDGRNDRADDGTVSASVTGVPALASALHVTPRHLHRVLVESVGAGPLALARTRRAQTARLLLDATELPISAVAFAAGFDSIRTFNDTMTSHFGASPRELRRARRQPGQAGMGGTASDGALTLRLAHRAPYDAPTMLDWLRRHVVAGLEEVEGTTYRRVLTGGSVVSVELGSHPPTVTMPVDDLATLPTTVAGIRRLLDLDADPVAVDAALSEDKMLAPLVAARPGLRVPGCLDPFELVVRTVLGQQVSLVAAHTFAARLVATYGTTLATPVGTLTAEFPGPATLAEASYDGIGLTSARVRTLRAVAQATLDGSLQLAAGSDPAEARAALLALPGIGPWTADYVLMRGLGDPDAFPATDLVLARRTVDLEPARWSPWRSYAAMHLWADHLANLDGPPHPSPAPVRGRRSATTRPTSTAAANPATRGASR